MAKNICIVCGKEKNGIEIKSDFIIESIRWFKRNITKNEQSNRLVVCKECYPKYKELWSKQSGRQKLYIGLGLAFAVVSLLISPRVGTVAIAALLLLFLYLLSLLNYVPRIKLK